MAVAIEAKITAPITWDTHPKFKIQDLHENQYDEVLRLIKHHYFAEEPMCRSIQMLQDPASVKTYLGLIRTWMKDTTSLVAVSQKTERIVGTVIIRINRLSERTDTYNRIQILEGEALDSIRQLTCALVQKANVYEALDHDTYLRVYVLIVHPSYKKKGVGNALFEACSHLALKMKIPIIGGIFTSNEHQLIAENVGFSLLTEIPYNNWLVDEEIVFDDPGIGNYSAAFMFMMTPDEETLMLNKKLKEKENIMLQKKSARKQSK